METSYEEIYDIIDNKLVQGEDCSQELTEYFREYLKGIGYDISEVCVTVTETWVDEYDINVGVSVEVNKGELHKHLQRHFTYPFKYIQIPSKFGILKENNNAHFMVYPNFIAKIPSDIIGQVRENSYVKDISLFNKEQLNTAGELLRQFGEHPPVFPVSEVSLMANLITGQVYLISDESYRLFHLNEKGTIIEHIYCQNCEHEFDIETSCTDRKCPKCEEEN